MGWKDAPLAQSGPVASLDTEPQQPAWITAPLADPAAAQPRSSKPLEWSDVPARAIENAPASALKFGEALIQPLIHPIDTGKAIFDVGYGLASKLHGKLGGTQDPEQKAKDEAVANAIGEHFKSRYGSMDGLKKALADDPVGVMADVSMVLTGGGALASRAPGVIGRAGEVIQATGNAIDPLRNAGRVAATVGPAVTNALGVTTGAGTRPLQEAYAAGRAGNQAFVDNMRGATPIDNVVDMAEAAVGQMGRDRRAAYTAQMTNTRNATQTVDFQPIGDALNRARDRAVYMSPTGQAILRNADALDVHTRITNLVNDFRRLPPNEQTPQALDVLKQSLRDIQQETRQGTAARGVADEVYNATRQEIVNQVPDYAAAMRDYAQASDNIGEMRRTLSINDRASTDTTLRKLQSTMRNNVNTNYGQREALLNTLAHYQPDLPAALAGQSLNALAPRGLMRGAAGGSAIYGLMSSPSTLAALPLTSPRLMGELIYGTGRGAQMLDDASQLLGFTPENISRAARVNYALGQFQPD